MKFQRINTLLFLLLLAAQTSSAQTYNFRRYSTEQGLPQSQVLSIFQDHKGYMWFGTNSGGISRFDGNTFVNYSKDNGLIDDNVYSIAQNYKNELFFGTSKGLSVYDQFTFRNFDERNGLKNSFVFKVLNDGNKIWIGTQMGVYLYEEGKVNTFDKDSVLANSSIWTILKDDKNNLWFATQQNGVICYDAKGNSFHHFSVKEGLLNNQVFSLAQMKNGTLLVGTLTGLNKISSNFQVSIASEIPAQGNICFWSSLGKGNNHFYFGTSSEGLMDFDFNTNSGMFFNAKNGLTNTTILSLLKDREGNLWVGTANGVYKYYNDRFVYYLELNGLLNNYVDKVNEDAQGNLWLAIAGNGLARIEKNKVTNFITDFKSKGSLPDNNVNVILITKQGKTYFGTNEGLCSFENEHFKIISNEIFGKKYIQSLYEDSRGTLWIGTTDGVFCVNNDNITEERIVNSFDGGGTAFRVFCIAEDRSGRMLFGLENGLLIYDGKKIKHIDDKNGFVNSRVTSMQHDAKNNLWFGTGAGLVMYDYKSFRRVLKEDGSSFGYITFLEVDQNNRLYIGTNNGADILQLSYFYQNKIRIKHIGIEDGLLAQECLFQSSKIDKKGRVLIGTPNGLTIYDPNQDRFNKNEARTSITDVKLFFGQETITDYSEGLDSTTLLPQHLILPHTKNNLTFHFIGISLLIPQKVMYTYKLEGLEKSWSPAVSNPQATYPSLPPGKYTFMVKAKNNDGLWNRIPTKYSFEVLCPWYRTWWFYSASALLLVSGILLFNYVRTKKLRGDKLKLEKIVQKRTHELRAEKEKVEVINRKVTEKNTEIENKNLEITDSIRYAKNIQEALLPSLAETEKAFKHCFILYLPKDIVSGDFFWYAESETARYIAAADCTGHGVPGAFMSIVGNTLLNEIVELDKIQSPGEILLQLHQSVKVALNQNSQELQRRDGMDIALCAISKNSGTIEFSGANRPLWIYRINEGYELEIVKPTKHPIGGLELEGKRVYENNLITVSEGDTLYFFSDGFADQFGGPKGKKFMIANMQKLLFENIEFPMRKQKENVRKAFEEWKKDSEQVDDVLVIGIRV